MSQKQMNKQFSGIGKLSFYYTTTATIHTHLTTVSSLPMIARDGLCSISSSSFGFVVRQFELDKAMR